jgi:type IV secretory pathway VirB10-like protein
MFFGSTIMTFALPYGAFIAAAVALFYLFRARHSGPRLRWSGGSDAPVASVTTFEPGPAPAPGVSAAATAAPVSAASVPAAPHVVPDPLEENVLADVVQPPAAANEQAADEPVADEAATDEPAADKTATDDEANREDGREG